MAVGFCLAAAFSALAGTKVRIATSIGNIDLELYDQDKPLTVQNFLKYVSSGRYNGTFIHRLAFLSNGAGFVVQGGGYKISGSSPTTIDKFDPVPNEFAVGPTYRNTMGTIAMAKIPATDSNGDPVPGGGPDSATSEWFINLGDNGANLDTQNGGFTVFGHVIAGLEILQRFNTTFNDANTAVDVVVSTGSLTEWPILNFANGQVLLKDLIFTTVSVLADPVPSAPESPTVRIKGPARITTPKATCNIVGTGSSSVVNVEWKLGAKGKFRQRSAGTSWKLRVSGLKKGTNTISVRGVSATGVRGALQKVRILRQ